MTEASNRDLSAAQIVVMCTLPVIGALLFTAFGVIEWADTEPAATVFYEKAERHLPSLPYLALIVFGTLHVFGVLSCRRDRLAMRIALCFIFVLPFIVFNVLNVPVVLGAYTGWALVLTVIGLIVAVPVAIIVAGSFFGLLLYLPVYATLGLFDQSEPNGASTWRKIYIAGGVVAAFIFFAAFGWKGSMSNQDVGFANGSMKLFDLQGEWLRIATAVALSCIAICLLLPPFWKKANPRAPWQFVVWFLAPVALVIAVVAQAITPLSASAAYRAFATGDLQSQLALLLRDGLPRKAEPIYFKHGEWARSRERLVRIGYQNGGIVAKRLTVLPTLELAKLGVDGEIAVSERPFDIAAERRDWSRSLNCSLDRASAVEVCYARGSTRIPGTNAYFPQTSEVLEIDIDGQTRTMRYDAFSPLRCIVRTKVGKYDFSAEYNIKCSERRSWREIAIAVEADLASAYLPSPGQ